MKVSVVIPVFNRPEMLLQAVSSVLSQTRTDFELVVIDDGSTEDLSQARKMLQDAGHVFHSITHGGVARARTIGIEMARGEWMALLDSDDRWLAGKLEQQCLYHQQHPDCVVSQCEETWYRNGLRVNRKNSHEMASGDSFLRSLELCCVSSSSVMFRKDVYQQARGYDQRLVVCEDYDFWLRVTLRHQIGLVPGPLVEKFGGHANQLSRSQPAMDRFRVYALVKLLLEETLTIAQQKAVLREVKRKAGVLSLGAEKRGNREYTRLFGQLAVIAQQTLESGPRSDSDLSDIFQGLFQDLIRVCAVTHQPYAERGTATAAY